MLVVVIGLPHNIAPAFQAGRRGRIKGKRVFAFLLEEMPSVLTCVCSSLVREVSFSSGHLAVSILNAFLNQNLGFIRK